MESQGKAFRQLLRDEPYVFTGGIYSPLDAQIAERVGMKAIYLSGYSVAMLNGWPDMGFLTMTERSRSSRTPTTGTGRRSTLCARSPST